MAGEDGKGVPREVVQNAEHEASMSERRAFSRDARGRLRELSEKMTLGGELISEDSIVDVVTSNKDVRNTLIAISKIDTHRCVVVGETPLTDNLWKEMEPYIDHDARELFTGARGLAPGILLFADNEGVDGAMLYDLWKRMESSWKRYALHLDEAYIRIIKQDEVESGYIEDVSLGAILGPLKDHIANLQSKSGLHAELTLEVGEGVEDCVIECHAGTLYSRLVNLFNNPAKKEDLQAKHVSFAITVEQEGDEVIFTIEDDGIGMAKDVIEHVIFMPGESRTDRGTGFGTAYTDTLIQSMGGSFHLESQEEAGERHVYDTDGGLYDELRQEGGSGTSIRIGFKIKKTPQGR